MRFLLDTNIVSDLVRHPRGKISDRLAEVGEEHVCTSIIVAAELRFGAAMKNSSRLTAQLEAVLGAIDVLPLEAPVDAVYGAIRAKVGANRPAHWRKRLAHSRSRTDFGPRSSDR
jgi:tRNA(fMet)-specific endonuclease VapC